MCAKSLFSWIDFFLWKQQVFRKFLPGVVSKTALLQPDCKADHRSIVWDVEVKTCCRVKLSKDEWSHVRSKQKQRETYARMQQNKRHSWTWEVTWKILKSTTARRETALSQRFRRYSQMLKQEAFPPRAQLMSEHPDITATPDGCAEGLTVVSFFFLGGGGLPRQKCFPVHLVGGSLVCLWCSVCSLMFVES